MDDFIEKENFMNLLSAFLKRKRDKVPEPGAYDVAYPEKHLAEVNFDLMKGR